MKSWHIANTTVRTPYRLREALIALKSSEFLGNLLGPTKEHGFARLLNEGAIVKSERIIHDSGTDSSDLGRKWRSALAQLGFVVPHFKRGLKRGIDPVAEYLTSGLQDLTGRPYEITPNGFRLIHAESVREQQECFLRALMAYRIPSIVEIRYDFPHFSPLRFILDILCFLEKNLQEPIIKFEEMAYIIQRSTPEQGIDPVVTKLLEYRKARKESSHKKKFDLQAIYEAVQGDHKKARTLHDYADLNFRYLKATGLFQSKGRSITILPQRKMLVDFLVSDTPEPYNDKKYAETLWQGAKLPTDDKIKATNIIKNLSYQLSLFYEETDISYIHEKTMDELTKIRFHLEERLQHLRETEFAKSQADSWEEITNYMKAFMSNSRKRVVSKGGESVHIPSAEAPAYFEWVIWRAFLAINSTVNKPWEARRFKVDQDFLPLSHAPGGGPDMIFEFEDYVLVVEVTLTSSSRQEAYEGEPVRRHVAEIAEKFEKTGKRVYCLFIAININSNTAETFKIGNWYKKDDTKIPLQIVPLKLKDFIHIFDSGFKSRKLEPSQIQQLMIACRAQSNRDAPDWKNEITVEVERFISNNK
jgi:hypothetical protein